MGNPYGLGIIAGWAWCNENMADNYVKNPFPDGSMEYDTWDEGWCHALSDWEVWLESDY